MVPPDKSNLSGSDRRKSGVSNQNRSVSHDATLVRDALEADMAAVRDIYAHYVLHSLATFEETPPTLEDMMARRRASVDLDLPYLVAEAGGVVAGFAYAGLYRSRPAYRYALEDSVYVADGQTGRGIGSALLGELIARCERGPWRQILAVVGDSGNSGSSVASALRIRTRRDLAIGRIQVRPLGRYADPATGDWTGEAINTAATSSPPHRAARRRQWARATPLRRHG
jgi:L-amino acid N-acyltransferase YncA